MMMLTLTVTQSAGAAEVTATADADVSPNFIDIYRSDTGEVVKQQAGGQACTYNECEPNSSPRTYVAFISTSGDTSAFPPTGVVAMSRTVISTNLCIE
jgi:hypothetical protein